MAERVGFDPPDTVAHMPHFECGAFDHLATSPRVWSALFGAGCLIAMIVGAGDLRLGTGSVAEACLNPPISGAIQSPSHSLIAYARVEILCKTHRGL